ncbi:MAG: preprotein translocase subunit SecG [Candidatus Saccharibacteria bacterium]|jgi:preprotein translocase subunit SecG
MLSILNFVIGLSSVLLIIVVLMQNQGSGLGDAFGGSAATNTYRSKRGLERGLFIMTIVLAIVLVAGSLARIVVS